MSSYSLPAKTWLQAVFTERFGTKLKLVDTGNSIRLSLPGSADIIDILSNPQIFRGEGRDVCAEWNAIAEGWSGPVAERIPAPCVHRLHVPLIERTDVGYTIHYDVLGLMHWMLSRAEELSRTDLDDHQRFPAIASHSYRYGYLSRPIVDEWLEIIRQVIQRTWPQLELKQHSFGMKVSHDVDSPSRYGFRPITNIMRIVALQLLRLRDLDTALRVISVWLNSRSSLDVRDPENTFNWIMDQSEKRDLKSAFYFICGRTDISRDANYEPEHPAIRNLMRQIHSRGHEIGLHPSYGTYQHSDKIRMEADRLRRICMEEDICQEQWGGRMHFLRWEQPTTLRAWNDAGMAYDSTLAYADHPGFRCGTCYEYPAFDPVADEMLNLRIRPLVVMECTVTAPRYLGLGFGETALDKFCELKNTCRAVNGSFTLLWHNSLLSTEKERRLYLEVLDA